MNLSIDEAFAQLRAIAAALDALPPGHEDRPGLEARRDELREAAKLAADLSRNPTALRRELETLQARLTELERRKIRRSLMEHGRWINDPSAYAAAINKRISEGTAEERAAVEERIEVLRASLAEMNESEGGGDRSPG